jgi:hypothetical protein
MYMQISRGGSPVFSCVSKATYGGKIHGTDAETISDMSDCNKKPVEVRKGDSMMMSAEYDLKAHPLYVQIIYVIKNFTNSTIAVGRLAAVKAELWACSESSLLHAKSKMLPNHVSEQLRFNKTFKFA